MWAFSPDLCSLVVVSVLGPETSIADGIHADVGVESSYQEKFVEQRSNPDVYSE